jgi:hypothetical protein
LLRRRTPAGTFTPNALEGLAVVSTKPVLEVSYSIRATLHSLPPLDRERF